MMKQLHFFLLIFIFCFGTIIFAQVIPDFQVNEEVAGDDYYTTHPKISVDESGNYIITWEEGHNDKNGIYAQRYSNDGTALGVNFKVNDDSSGVGMPSISLDNNGNFVIAWKSISDNHFDLYARRYTNNGTALDGKFKVNDDEGSVSGDRGGFPAPSVSMDDIGNFVIAWEDWRNDKIEIYAQRYSNDGTALGVNFKVNDDSSEVGIPSISLDNNGNFVITWHDTHNGNQDVYAQRYANDGTVIGSNFKVSDDTSDAVYPSISTDNNGNFVITFMDNRNGNWDVYLQRYSSDGIPLGANLKVNDDDGSIYEDYFVKPSISSDNDGNFVINWGDWEDELEFDVSIYAQRYSNEGIAKGNNFLVTNFSENIIVSPDVKLWNGRIYNVWEVILRDSNSWVRSDVWANVLDWDNPVGINDRDMVQLPSTYQLSHNYPNPFNPTTAIGYQLSAVSDVELSIYNLLGQKVATLVSERKNAGNHQVEWDAGQLSSGVYYYMIKAGEFQDVKKMILLR